MKGNPQWIIIILRKLFLYYCFNFSSSLWVDHSHPAPSIIIYLNIAENTHIHTRKILPETMCVLISLCLSLFHPGKINSNQNFSGIWIFLFILFLLYYFYSVTLWIFSCSPMEKGNKMLNCYEGMETGGVLWMLCVNYLRHCIWKLYVLCQTRIPFCPRTVTLCM